jgi:hypothetical protein
MRDTLKTYRIIKENMAGHIRMVLRETGIKMRAVVWKWFRILSNDELWWK